MAQSYAFAGSRQGFKIDETDQLEHCSDGYTKVMRDGSCVAVYRTELIVSTPAE